MSDDLIPPARFAGQSFATYDPQTPSQKEALEDARELTRRIGARYARSWWKRLTFRGNDSALRSGLYLVGPVGTGKTHLLVSMYRELHPRVPCAFVHSSRIFRSTEHPERYAAMLAERYDVLLIDEVELDDPANEIRLIVVLKELHRLGVTVAATSNAEPEKFVSAQFGRDRLERFISEQFRKTYHVVFVGGEDFRKRLEKPGRAWIGSLDAADAAMRARYEDDRGRKLWLSWDDLLARSVRTERTQLTDDLAQNERLYLSGLRIDSSDDAVRLLRVIDDLYDHRNPPTLFFTSEAVPDRWWSPSNHNQGIEAAIAEKFSRTVSRLNAMCAIERVGQAAVDDLA